MGSGALQGWELTISGVFGSRRAGLLGYPVVAGVLCGLGVFSGVFSGFQVIRVQFRV